MQVANYNILSSETTLFGGVFLTSMWGKHLSSSSPLDTQ